jgi:hypothetical protein
MGRGRGREAILAALGVVVLAAGCGAESHPNDPRPPISAEVTVNITDASVQAQPSEVGVKGGGGTPIGQNTGAEQIQADRKAPLVVNFTISNTTITDTTLEIHGEGGFSERSGPVVAQGNAIYKLALPNGNYSLEAADLPGAAPARFFVGPERVSSQNDLLLP